jgi:predicted RNA binding protein YcfA (HicA-like mRNA interferase family)
MWKLNSRVGWFIMRSSVTYRELEHLLLSHGFELNRVKGSHHLFVHSPSDTTIMLPEDSSSRPALPSQVAAVERILDERGLLSRDQFEASLRRNGHTTARR